MVTDERDPSAALAAIVSSHTRDADIGPYRARLRHLVASVSPALLADLAGPYRDDPEVIAPVYERIVEAFPENAQAMVVLANAYWLQGRGPDAVGELATRALSVDPANRGAWHLWALSEAEPRRRTLRWGQVSDRFPDDMLALAALADNAAAVAGAERDYEMLDLAIDAYERLLDRAPAGERRETVERALHTLREWRL
jgi:hypothetical protein